MKSNEERIKSVSLRVARIHEELKLFGYVIHALLCFYAYPTTGFSDYPRIMSEGMHILLALKRASKQTLPNQLYHDLQGTFENFFVCSAKFQSKHPDLPFYIFLLGTDVLERFFGNVRLLRGANELDNLGLINSSRAIKKMSQVMDDHPGWTAKANKIMERLCLDYCSPDAVDAEKMGIRDLDLLKEFNRGRSSAETKIVNSTNDDLNSWDLIQLVSQGITFKCPHKSGKVIGVSASEPPEDQEVILAGEFSPDARVVVTEEDIAEASTTGDVRIGEDQDLSTSADR